MAATRERAPIGSSRTDIATTMVVGGIAAIAIIVALVLRLAEVLPNRSVPVRVWLDGEQAVLPVGSSGARVPVSVEGGTILVSGLPGITLTSVALEAAVPALAAVAIIACVLLLCRNLLSGRAFSPGNTRLVTAISLLIASGWALSLLFTTMANNGAVAAMSGGELDSATLQVDWVPVLASMAVGAVAAAFRRGERLERDTDGLV